MAAFDRKIFMLATAANVRFPPSLSNSTQKGVLSAHAPIPASTLLLFEFGACLGSFAGVCLRHGHGSPPASHHRNLPKQSRPHGNSIEPSHVLFWINTGKVHTDEFGILHAATISQPKESVQ